MTSTEHVRPIADAACVPGPAPYVPREMWDAHPHFPSQALLLNSHANFRRVSDVLIARVNGALHQPDSYNAWSDFSLYMRWIMGMRGHEHYEESKLYPYLTRRYNVSTSVLEEEHEALHGLDDAVRRAFHAVQKHPGERDELEALKEALQAHDRAMKQHLIDEEDMVIPLLLSLPPEEFERYYRSHIDTLLANSVCACGPAAKRDGPSKEL